MSEPISEAVPMGNSLKALRYHRNVCEWLEKYEPKVWQWFSDLEVLEKSFDSTRDALLKETYRLTVESHPTVYELCQIAMQRLGIEAGVTVYQANDGAMNAALFYVPKEVHIVLYGPLIDKLSNDELLALLGHELSHYLLWSMEGSRYLVAQQILEDSVAQTPNSALYETARLFALNTEVFADRGGVIAAENEKYTISVLVKVMTGLSQVDADSFISQAKELDAKGEVSEARSHPELYMRALFLDKWQRGEHEIDDWLDTKLKGPLSISCLDVLDQIQLSQMTSGFFRYFLNQTSFASERVINQIQLFFADWESRTNEIDLAQLDALKVDESTQDYFIALVFDIAHADSEQTDEVLQRDLEVMSKLGWLERYRENLKTILKFPKRKADKLVGDLPKVPAEQGAN
jgi:hypothetical protein